MRLAKIIEKNFLLVWRSKGAIAIILLGPLLMAFLIGSTFSSSYSYFASVGIHEAGAGGSELAGTIKQNVAKNFEIETFDSQEGCIKGVKTGAVNICLLLPQGLDVERSQGANEIEIYADNSRTNLVWAVLESLSTSISETSSNISLRLTEELIQKLAAARKELANDSLLANDTLDLLSVAASDSVWLKEGIVSLKTNADTGNIMLGKISKDARAGYDELSKLEKKIGELAKEGRESLDDALDAVENSSMPLAQKDAIEELVEEVEDSFDSIASAAVKSKNSTQAAVGELNSTLATANDEVEKIKEAINSFVEFKQAGFSKLAAVSTSLDKTQEIIGKLSSSFGNLLAATAVTNADASYIVTPIVKKVMSISPATNQLRNIFPTLLVIVVVFTSLILSSAVTVAEKSSKAFFRNSITPADELEFIAAGCITNLAIISLQLLVFIAASVVFLNISIAAIGNAILLSLLAAAVFVLFGMMIGEIFSSQEGSVITSLLFGSLLLFFSNTLVPLEGFPALARAMAGYNPFVIAESLLRKTMLHGIALKGLLNDIFILLVYAAVVFAILAALAKLERARALRNYQKAPQQPLRNLAYRGVAG